MAHLNALVVCGLVWLHRKKQNVVVPKKMKKCFDSRVADVVIEEPFF